MIASRENQMEMKGGWKRRFKQKQYRLGLPEEVKKVLKSMHRRPPTQQKRPNVNHRVKLTLESFGLHRCLSATLDTNYTVFFFGTDQAPVRLWVC